jgi:hypothetical protein
MIVQLTECLNKEEMRLTGHLSRMRERRAEFRILIGQCEGRRLFGRPRYEWDENIINGS